MCVEGLDSGRAAADARAPGRQDARAACSRSTSGPATPLETNCAIADVEPGSAEIWSSLKSPIGRRRRSRQNLGLSPTAVKCHVTQGGGSFGRHLFSDAAFEAAAVSQKLGKPVKLMWHRTDNFRQGRMHPMCTSRVRVTYSGANVLGFDQRHTSVATDFTHGFGEILRATYADLPKPNSLGFSAGRLPADRERALQLRGRHPAAERDLAIPTRSTRAACGTSTAPRSCTAKELMVDQVARAMGQGPVQVPAQLLRDEPPPAVLDTVAKTGRWGQVDARGNGAGDRRSTTSTRGARACLVEIDCTARDGQPPGQGRLSPGRG